MSGPSLAQKKEKILEYLAAGDTVADMLHRFEPALSESTFYSMRKADQDFDSEVRSILDFKRATTTDTRSTKGIRQVFDPDRPVPPDMPFDEWRMHYLGRPTEPLHQAIADAVADSTTSRTVILAPPGGGKDTTVGDAVLKLKARDRNYTRVAWIMQTGPLSERRVSERIAPYLDDPKVYDAAPVQTPGAGRPKGSLIEDYGPFKWSRGMKYPDGSPVVKQTWTKNEMRFLQSSRAPEADPDLWATGVEGELYGSRVNLMIWSDLFTRENQKNPERRASQFSWLTLTAFSRLDARGRLVVIGTRVSRGDNYQRLIEWLVPAEMNIPIRSEKREGPLEVIRYANGVCVIRCKAIWEDDEGVEHSFSPRRFPLDDMWETPDGEMFPVDDYDADYAQAHGWARVEGLRTIRARDPETFECAYQQNPTVDADAADFKPELLDLCVQLGADRSFGTYQRNEMLVQCIDPARAQGAAFAVLAADFDRQTITVVDDGWFQKLGIPGIKNQLVMQPALKWQPQWVVYEGNHEQGIMHDSSVQEAFKAIGAQVEIVRTGDKRSDPVVGIASVGKEMRQGRLIIPSATPADMVRAQRIKRHFLAWDKNPKSSRSQKPHEDPDDLAMAIAFGVLFIRRLFDRQDRQRAAQAERSQPRGVPPVALRRYADRNPGGSRETRPRTTVTGADFARLLTGDFEG